MASLVEAEKSDLFVQSLEDFHVQSVVWKTVPTAFSGSLKKFQLCFSKCKLLKKSAETVEDRRKHSETFVVITFCSLAGDPSQLSHGVSKIPALFLKVYQYFF